MIRVLVVDDSPLLRQKVRQDLASSADLMICGTAGDGAAGVAATLRLHPDVVVMDLNMPEMDGYAATRAIMEQHPVPIIVLTTEDGHDASRRAFESGALEFVSKRTPGAKLAEIIRLVSTVKVVGFHVRPRTAAPGVPRSDGKKTQPPVPPIASKAPGAFEAPKGIVAVGASTGGPQALQSLLSSMLPNLPVSLAVVQHMAVGFLGPMIEWLQPTASLSLKIAADGDRLQSGVAYFAPDHAHLRIDENERLRLDLSAARNGVRPSVDVLFESAARLGPRALGLLMTGMGNDGATGLRALFDAGAMTMTQSEESCVIFGMPAEAVKLGASRAFVDPPGAASNIAAWLRRL